jgi:phosphatidylserine decarboxylase
MIKKTLLSFLAHPVFSRIYGRLTRIRRPGFLVRFIIRRFAAHYGIDLTQFQGSPDDYASLSDFFVRPLNPAVRPLNTDPSSLLSPCDGRVADLQPISANEAIQVKGKPYRLSDLLGRDLDWSRGWWLCTLYLSPANYHRFHYPISATLTDITQLGNRLFPVNRHGVENIPGLFVRNERLVLAFKKEDIPFYAVAVGATFVGSILLTALDNKTLKSGRQALGCPVKQLAEMGRFNLGSTIILVLPKDWADPLDPEDKGIITGQPLFRLR